MHTNEIFSFHRWKAVGSEGLDKYEYTLIEKYMAQSLHFGLYGSSTNLPSGICAIYFYLKVYIYRLFI